MERIQINLTKPIYSTETLDVIKIEEHTDKLVLTLNNVKTNDIRVGSVFVFTRTLYNENGLPLTLNERVEVIHKEDINVVYTTKIEPIRYRVLNKYENVKHVQSNTDDYYVISTSEPHNIFFQDINWDNHLGSGQEIYIYNSDDKLLGTFSDLAIPLKYSNKIVTSGNFITNITKEKTCHKSYRYVTTHKYSFIPDSVNRNELIVKDFTPSIMDEMEYFTTRYNQFYWYLIEYNEDGTPVKKDIYGNPVKTCYLYDDTLWQVYSSISFTSKDEEYVSDGTSQSKLLKEGAYWDVNIGLSSYSEENSLGTEDYFSTAYIKEVEDSLIPQVIDMERIKFCPMAYSANSNTKLYKWTTKDNVTNKIIYTNSWIGEENTELYGLVDVYDKNNTKLKLDVVFAGNNCLMSEDATYISTNEIIRDDLNIATSITFNLHFRKRLEVNDITRKNNSMSTSGNVYADGWYIDPDNTDYIWWNGMNYNDSEFNQIEFNKFIEKNGEVSDLIGYLNFTDSDVLNRKKKVSQSFLRLSFYTSKDPIEQKLLYYSTIFIDTNVLYGKYIKQLLFTEDNGVLNEVDNKNAFFVFYDENPDIRLDTRIVVTNEYDRTKSAEGFNLYLFEADKNIGLNENGERTIYMKVEFNHAGNGKTLPMIMWPKSGSEYTALTVDNFMDSLYIPINLTYFNGRYVYYIPDAFKHENGNISLVLFEPKLDFINEEP